MLTSGNGISILAKYPFTEDLKPQTAMLDAAFYRKNMQALVRNLLEYTGFPAQQELEKSAFEKD